MLWQTVWKIIPNMKIAHRVAIIVHVKNLDNKQKKKKDTNYSKNYIDRQTYVFCNNIHTAQQATRSIMFGWNGIRRWIVVYFFFFSFFLLSKFFINDKKKHRITFCLFHIGFSLLLLLLLPYFHSTLIAFLIPKWKSRYIQKYHQ